MAEKKVTVPLPPQLGGPAEGREVAIKESTERWTEIELEDGTRVRVKPNVLSAIRLDNRFDADGNPMYVMKGSQTMMIVSSPEHLRQNTKVSKVQ
jgi:S-adenosylhomocysteine hydrolase